MSESMMNQRSYIYLCLLFSLTSLTNCARRVQRSVKNPVENQSSKPEDTDFSWKLVDPKSVSLVLGPVSIESSDFGPEFKIPTLGMNFQGNDYVQILRCKESYLTELKNHLNSKEQNASKWAWYDAFGNSLFCKVVSRRNKSTPYQDITAQNGRFFYVVNPCVSQELSTTKSEECSFRLALSEVAEFDANLSSGFYLKATELSDMEARYDFITTKIRYKIVQLLNQKEDCEQGLQSVADKKRVSLLKQTFITIGASLAGGGLFLGVRKFLGKNKTGTTTSVASGKTSSHIVTTTTGIVSTVAAVSVLLQDLFQDKSAQGIPACQLVQTMATELKAFEDSQELERLQTDLVNKSFELSQLKSDFEGYNHDMFKAP